MTDIEISTNQNVPIINVHSKGPAENPLLYLNIIKDFPKSGEGVHGSGSIFVGLDKDALVTLLAVAQFAIQQGD